jgi:hypothetical protein
MTYCVGILVDTGLVMLSDSRTNAGVDQINTFRKMATFQRAGDRVLVLLSAGNLAITQAVVNRCTSPGEPDQPDRDLRRPRTCSTRRAWSAMRCAKCTARRRIAQGPGPRLQRDLHPGRPDRGRGAAAVQHLFRRQFHRVLDRHAVFSDRRVEVRQAHHRSGDLAQQQPRAGRQVRADLHGLDHPLESLGGPPLDLAIIRRDEFKLRRTSASNSTTSISTRSTSTSR